MTETECRNKIKEKEEELKKCKINSERYNDLIGELYYLDEMKTWFERDKKWKRK